METGFETIGNAILTLYDGGRPVLVTDPWFTPQAYFGSWGQSHEIPAAQMRGILGCGIGLAVAWPLRRIRVRE